MRAESRRGRAGVEIGARAGVAVRGPLLAAAVAWSAACGGEGEGDPAPGPEVAADSLAVDTTSVVSPTPAPDPFPSLPGEGEPRLYRLRLVNPQSDDAVVFARAGAARVALDTVPAQDSVHVDIRLRADRVELDAEDRAGRALSAAALELDPSGVNRWVIVVEGEPGDGPRTALVRVVSERYPRTRSD